MREEGKSIQETNPQFESPLRAVAIAPQSLLMLDYDGSLAPFREDRHKWLLTLGIAPVLQEIVRSTF
jgi:trehalose-6-phosphatase